MNTLPHIISLHHGTASTLAYAWQRLQSAWAEHRASRAAEAAEHELVDLDPRTLQDIGAPYGLVGQRRWQDEQREARATDRLLDLRGW